MTKGQVVAIDKSQSKEDDDSIQYFRPSSGEEISGAGVGGRRRRRRFAEWLPWKLFQDQMNPDKANHGWFIGRYARECLHILPNLPTCIKWPFHQTSVVLEWHQVDESLREPGIYYGYRPEVSSWIECCHSLFTANNETLNFWTHFFPTVFFIWRTVQLAGQWNSSKDDLHSAEYAQSFMAYMMTAILYPCMSAVAHGFSALSHRARAVLFFMDYAAINFYAYGSALLYRSYVLPDRWMVNQTGTNIYLTVCFVLSLASTALTCTSRAFVRDVVAQRLMRLAAFTLPYIWVSIPLFARLINCFGLDESTSCPTPDTLRAAKYHLCQVIVALMASFCYASHLPERVMPGTFDYVGHSHNLLHICGVTATFFQMEGALLDMEVRRSFLIQNHLAMVDPYWNFWVPVILLGGHVLLIAGFGLYIYWNEAATVECEKKKFKCH